MQYLPFGSILVEQKVAGQSVPYKFGGKELDEGTGLYSLGVRYYNPELGIFLSPDAYASQAPGWTPYRYGFNNPLRFSDPTGNFEVDEVDDWILTSSGAVVYDTRVTDASSAHERYGADAVHLGESASYMDGNGQQITLNSGGYASSSVLLDVATVTGKRPESWTQKSGATATVAGVGISTTDAVIDASVSMSGAAKDLASTTRAIGGVTRGAGLATGAIGLRNDYKSLKNNGTIGNGLKVGFSFGTLAYGLGKRANPKVTLGLGLFDLFAKEKTATKIDRIVDNISYHRYLDQNKIQLKARR